MNATKNSTFIYPTNLDAEALEGYDAMAETWSFDLDQGEAYFSDTRWDGEAYRGTICAGDARYPFTLPLPGKHNLRNLLAAVLGVRALGLKPDMGGLEFFENSPQRSMLVRLGNFRALDDTYNANPASMEAALETVSELAGKGRVHAVCGSMFELGSGAAEYHRAVGKRAAELGFYALIAFGDLGEHILEGAQELTPDQKTPSLKTLHTHDPNEAAQYLLEHAEAGDMILFKGSRGARTERVLDALRKKLEISGGHT